MFNLHKILDHEDIVIQCHNFPDADTIASGFAIDTYLKEHGKSSRLVYSGPAKITKPNLVKMVELLRIPIEHVSSLPPAGTLIMADCQYGESNVAKFDAETVFVLDHHEDKGEAYLGLIQSTLGSCSTLIWDMLTKTGFDLTKHPNVSSALYYGLLTDTNSFEEISHPLDKDMRDSVKFDQHIINTLRFNNLTIEELNIAGAALSCNKVNRQYGYAIFKAEACDQNILGFISDLALQVEGVGVCIVYNTLPSGYKLSIRSCIREVMANEFASFLAGGGGHRQKAGGYIPKDKLTETDIDNYIEIRTNEYFESYDVIDAANHSLDIASMSKFKKLQIPVSYVRSTDIFTEGTPMLIRTLEGDSDVYASDGIFLMIGLEGEVYPIKAEKFAQSYITTDQTFEHKYSYSPTVKNKTTGDVLQLESISKPCIPTGEVRIHAAPIAKNTKVFTSWNPFGYMFGKAGDFIATRANDPNDVYIIREDIFYKTYASCE